MTTKFIDGPAAGTVLSLQRAPLMLRVVVDKDGKVDALDQLADSPKPNESVHCYIMHGPPGPTGFIDGRDPKTGRRWGHPFASATYRLYECPPSEAILRFNAFWAEWVHANAYRLMAEHMARMPGQAEQAGGAA